MRMGKKLGLAEGGPYSGMVRFVRRSDAWSLLYFGMQILGYDLCYPEGGGGGGGAEILQTSFFRNYRRSYCVTSVNHDS